MVYDGRNPFKSDNDEVEKTRKYIEQWIMWMLANLAGIVLNVFVTFSDINNLPILIMWVIFLLNSIYGYVSWRREAKL
jgi:nicotinamide mononucleotide transporter